MEGGATRDAGEDEEGRPGDDGASAGRPRRRGGRAGDDARTARGGGDEDVGHEPGRGGAHSTRRAREVDRPNEGGRGRGAARSAEAISGREPVRDLFLDGETIERRHE